MTVEHREKVKLVMHLPGGYSKVLLESTIDVGLASGAIHWDIPTEAIPLHLRGFGCRPLVIASYVSGKSEAEEMTAEQIRGADRVYVQEITDE